MLIRDVMQQAQERQRDMPGMQYAGAMLQHLDVSPVPTGILPLDQIKSYVAIVDVEDPSFDACKTSILNYFRAHDIRGSIFFQDFRKIGSEDRLITSIQTKIGRAHV